MPNPADKTTPKPPKRPAKATKPKAGKGKASASKTSRRGSPQFDWSAIRREFIRGDDTVTLKSLSVKEGYPAYDTLKARAAAEDWTDLRVEFQHQVDTKLRQVDVDLKTEVRKRHAGIGKGMTNIGAQALQTLGAGLKARGDDAQDLMRQVAERLAKGESPDSPAVLELIGRAIDARTFARLDTMDIVRFIKYGTDLERKAMGMEEMNINFRNITNPEDLDRLTDDQLWQLMGQLPPEDADEDW